MSVFKTFFSSHYKRPLNLINTHDASGILQLEEALTNILSGFNKCSHIVALCIGSDRCTGDSLGPFVGYYLSELCPGDIPIFGTVDSPVHALNLAEITKHIYYNYNDAAVLAVDAALGKSKNVGMLEVGEGSLVPGAAVQKKLPPVGDLHITAIVNSGGCMDFAVLQTTRLSLVLKMANFIARGIYKAVYKTDYMRTTSDRKSAR